MIKKFPSQNTSEHPKPGTGNNPCIKDWNQDCSSTSFIFLIGRKSFAQTKIV